MYFLREKNIISKLARQIRKISEDFHFEFWWLNIYLNLSETTRSKQSTCCHGSYFSSPKCSYISLVQNMAGKFGNIEDEKLFLNFIDRVVITSRWPYLKVDGFCNLDTATVVEILGYVSVQQTSSVRLDRETGIASDWPLIDFQACGSLGFLPYIQQSLSNQWLENSSGHWSSKWPWLGDNP
jgi:hypothetical protein